MRLRILLLFGALVCIGSTAFAQWIDPTVPPPFTLTIAPAGILPMGRDSALFPWGYGVQASGDFRIRSLPPLILSADLGFQNLALKGTPSPLSGPLIFSAGAEAGVTLDLFAGLSARVFGGGGGFYGFLAGIGGANGFNPYAMGGVSLSYRFSPFFSIGLETSYLVYMGLYNGLTADLGMSLHKPAFIPRLNIPNEPPLPKGPPPSRLSALEIESARKEVGGLDIDVLSFNDVFPIFFKFYNDNPVGSATFHNWGKVPVENVTISFFAKQYMDNPKRSQRIPMLGPGEIRQLDFYGLFKSTMLEISEQTLVSVNVSVDYTIQGKQKRREFIKELRIRDRNSMTWDDDRRAAAFVTAKDPTVLKFTKNVLSLTKGQVAANLNQKLITAMAIHQALMAYGLSYVVDPTTPHAKVSQSKTAVDFLQFPQQTLEYKAGDCDDLSILYSALLESVGIQTAFITIPGHIYLAISLEITPEEAGKTFLNPQSLIMQKNSAWLPIEVTQREGGFLKAWETGAKEWRDNNARGLAAFYPLQDCWSKYEAVGFSGAVVPINLPEDAAIRKSFVEEVARFINMELSPRVASLQAALLKSPDSPQLTNKLGILYAQYGELDQAEQQFSKGAAKSFLPAVLNLGNIRYMRGDTRKALSLYQQAQKADPSNAKALLGLAHCLFDMGSYEEAKKAYVLLAGSDPDLAERFAYLASGSQGTARAADTSGLKGAMVWADQ